MRALLDEQGPADLAACIRVTGTVHEIRMVGDEGWRGMKNGTLLRALREAGFGALVTLDRRMEYQQNIARSGIALIVLHAFRARLRELEPLAPEIARALDRAEPGEIIHLRIPPPEV